MATTTHLSLHLITSITATAPGAFGDPLVLRLRNRYGDTDITLFFETGDTGLTKRLVEAINTATIGPILPPPEAAHEADARALGWMTDEEKHPETGPYHGVVHPDGWWAPDWQAACEKSAREAANYHYNGGSR